jgi:hypothetical protein
MGHIGVDDRNREFRTGMPRYFFDTFDGERLIPDVEGLEMQDLAAAKSEAQKALPDLAGDAVPDCNHRTFVVSVRDEAANVVLRATLSLVVEEGTLDD